MTEIDIQQDLDMQRVIKQVEKISIEAEPDQQSISKQTQVSNDKGYRIEEQSVNNHSRKYEYQNYILNELLKQIIDEQYESFFQLAPQNQNLSSLISLKSFQKGQIILEIPLEYTAKQVNFFQTYLYRYFSSVRAVIKQNKINGMETMLESIELILKQKIALYVFERNFIVLPETNRAYLSKKERIEYLHFQLLLREYKHLPLYHRQRFGAYHECLFKKLEKQCKHIEYIYQIIKGFIFGNIIYQELSFLNYLKMATKNGKQIYQHYITQYNQSTFVWAYQTAKYKIMTHTLYTQSYFRLSKSHLTYEKIINYGRQQNLLIPVVDMIKQSMAHKNIEWNINKSQTSIILTALKDIKPKDVLYIQGQRGSFEKYFIKYGNVEEQMPCEIQLSIKIIPIKIFPLLQGPTILNYYLPQSQMERSIPITISTIELQNMKQQYDQYFDNIFRQVIRECLLLLKPTPIITMPIAKKSTRKSWHYVIKQICSFSSTFAYEAYLQIKGITISTMREVIKNKRQKVQAIMDEIQSLKNVENEENGIIHKNYLINMIRILSIQVECLQKFKKAWVNKPNIVLGPEQFDKYANLMSTLLRQKYEEFHDWE